MSAAVSIAPLRNPDRPAAAAVLARAFRDNPLNVAVIGSPSAERRLRANRHGMDALLPVAQSHGCALGASWDGRVAAALVATPPYAFPLPPPPLLARLRCLAGQGWRVARRWGAVFDALSPLHPPEPHAYLGTLGVDPELQGRGLGSALLEHWLSDVAQGGYPAYLETDAPANVAFYARAGFRVAGEVSLFGVRIWRMCRPPPG